MCGSLESRKVEDLLQVYFFVVEDNTKYDSWTWVYKQPSTSCFPRDWLRKALETKLIIHGVIINNNINQKQSGSSSIDWEQTHIQLIISALF